MIIQHFWCNFPDHQPYSYPTMRAKSKSYGLTLTWAHNLFVMWVLNFLLWVILNLETQQYNATLWIPLLSLLLLFLCSLLYLFFLVFQPPTTSSFSSLIYSSRLVEGWWLLLIVSGKWGPMPLFLSGCLVGSGRG